MNAETNECFYILGANGILEIIKEHKGKVTGCSLKTADGNFSAKKLDQNINFTINLIHEKKILFVDGNSFGNAITGTNN